MPKAYREDQADQIHHVIIQGRNREVLFPWDFFFADYLVLLKNASKEAGCRVHGYSLLGNHAHFLMTPVDDGGIGQCLQRANSVYARRLNRAFMRSGALFRERFWSRQIHDEVGVLQCLAYIELNPVRAGLCSEPDAYLWSSCGYHAKGLASDLITPAEGYLDLGPSPQRRQQRYSVILQDRNSRIWEPPGIEKRTLWVSI